MYITSETVAISPSRHHGGGRMDEALSRAEQGKGAQPLPPLIPLLFLFALDTANFICSFFSSPPFLPFLSISDTVSRASKTARHFKDEA